MKDHIIMCCAMDEEHVDFDAIYIRNAGKERNNLFLLLAKEVNSKIENISSERKVINL